MRMKKHSRFQVELKNHYPLDLSRKNCFALDVYLLSPFSLDVQESTYKRSEILSDTHIYTRYSIYETTLEELIREKNDRSPLVRIEGIIRENRLESWEEKRRLLYEYRVLANVFLDLMDGREAFLRDVTAGKYPQVNLKEEVVRFYELMEEFLTRYRGLAVPGEVRSGYLLADELISLTIERVLLPLLLLFNDTEEATGKKRIKRLLNRESEYRRTMGYARLEGDDPSEKDRERLVYRESILKKWAHSVNYMEKKRSSLNTNTNQLFAAVAAAVAMAFAVLAMVYANRYFVSYSLPWIIIAVFSYSLKDRIKEGLRNIFKNLLPQLISDRTDNLYDNLVKRPAGRARLTVEHVKGKDLPGEVDSFYRKGEDAFRSILPEENILHLRRKITIKGRRINNRHVRLKSLTEVFRFDLARFVRNMDDPEKTLWYLNEGKPRGVTGSRVYRLKFAVMIRRDREETRLNFYRVHMRQDGILRIEEIDSED